MTISSLDTMYRCVCREKISAFIECAMKFWCAVYALYVKNFIAFGQCLLRQLTIIMYNVTVSYVKVTRY